jgi:hypothetical protein
MSDVKIDWKPSELPAYTVIRAKHPWVSGIEAYWTKDDLGTWWEIEADSPAAIGAERQDELLDINYIESVPKSWYEEFRPLPTGPSFITFNRAGWIRYGDQMYTDPSRTPATFKIPFDEIVRRAFA